MFGTRSTTMKNLESSVAGAISPSRASWRLTVPAWHEVDLSNLEGFAQILSTRGATNVADVLLTHSYHLYYDRKQTRKMQPYPPLGTLYAAALLRTAGLSVALFDTMLSNPEEHFQAALKQHNPKIVVVYEDSFNFL